MKSYSDIAKAMRLQQFSDDQIQHFGVLYKTWRENKGQKLSWDTIKSPVAENISSYDNLSELEGEAPKELLGKLAVCRLNGGLGTSMGCVGPKSAIEVRDGLSFMDLIVTQISKLNQEHDVDVPLVLMNSFNTEQDTKKIIQKYQGEITVHTFTQQEFPRLRRDSLMPMTRKKYASMMTYPPGHGDFFPSIQSSGILDQLLAEGKEYLFIANADNLGASVDLKILSHLAETGAPYMMEVTEKTRADIKGGTLVTTDKHRLKLLEIAQVPEEYVEEFKSVKKFKLFNTNNIWVNLKALKKKLKSGLELEVIVNRKNVADLPVIQLETAIGGAISNFPDAQAVQVPRRRFLPVKKTDDLLLVQSNLFVVEQGALVKNPERQFAGLPLIRLGPNFAKIEDYQKRFKSIPDILELDLLTVVGDVSFGKGITLRGNVILVCEQGSLAMPDQALIENKVMTGSLQVGEL